jgi:hypothetical protein
MPLYGPAAPATQTQTTYTLQVFFTPKDKAGNPIGDPLQLGTVYEITPRHSRRNSPIGGVGIGDRRLELVPGRTDYTITLHKFSIWTKTLQQIMGRPVNERMLAELQIPFDIVVEHINPGSEDVHVTIYRDCQIREWRRTQRWSDEVYIADELDVDVRMIQSDDPSITDINVLY